MNNQRKLKAFLLATGSIIVFVILFMLLSQFKHFVPDQFERLAHGITGTFAALATIWLFLTIEKSTFREYGLRWEKTTVKKFVIGMAIGVGFSLIMIVSQVFYSGLEITLSDNQNIAFYIVWVPAIVILSFMEEAAFRSYAFVKLNKAFGLWVAQIVTGILFAFYHVSMGWPIALAFLGPGIWALVYGLSAVASNGISMPTGLHGGVNIILALFVGKLNIDSVWTIDFPTEASESMIQSNELFGVGLQVLLLIMGVIATEVYLRKGKIIANNIYTNTQMKAKASLQRTF